MRGMCGFAGEFMLRGPGASLALAGRMAQRLVHRGPDEEGSFASSDGRCAIGFRRLAILDVPASHQPMSTSDGAVTVAFNGEIYNFKSLRQELTLQGAAFRTSGDTETLLHLYRRWGADMLSRLGGMFAFALYDATRQSLLLARDRMGQKPLWYALLSDRIVFASEAKALLAHPGVGRDMDRESIAYYLTMGYIPAPRSAWAGVKKLAPAHWLELDGKREGPAEPRRYWSPSIAVSTLPGPELRQQTLERLSKAVEAHMVSDVPIGALLSGGIDSSLIVALMCRAAGKAGGVRTFTAAFDDPQYDERSAAAATAALFKTDHTVLPVSCNPAAALENLPRMYDEPFADSSALPTWLICQGARSHVKVALAGDGGDEVFGGYDRYMAMSTSASLGVLPFLAVRLAAKLLSPWRKAGERNRIRRFIRFADAIPYPLSVQYLMYRCLFSPKDLDDLLTADFLSGINSQAPAEWFCNLYEDNDAETEVQRAQLHDMATYLPDDLLVKSDIASMAASLELRAPMLDHDLVDLGLSLPVEMKIRRRRGKAILRDLATELVSPQIAARRKQGFGVPLGRWLRTDLAEPMRQTLLDQAFLNENIIAPQAIHGLINDHLSGRDDHSHRLWALLMLAKWLQIQHGA